MSEAPLIQAMAWVSRALKLGTRRVEVASFVSRLGELKTFVQLNDHSSIFTWRDQVCYSSSRRTFPSFRLIYVLSSYHFVPNPVDTIAKDPSNRARQCSVPSRPGRLQESGELD